jgi:hypothetical protein
MPFGADHRTDWSGHNIGHKVHKSAQSGSVGQQEPGEVFDDIVRHTDLADVVAD